MMSGNPLQNALERTHLNRRMGWYDFVIFATGLGRYAHMRTCLSGNRIAKHM